ncbi:MAG: carboxymuconolactone decarboxylase family protein [Dehalococcoidia bacterium]|nr:carboxymuconolactone decarboxylase family protein [Dehalococcoidia bacterium]
MARLPNLTDRSQVPEHLREAYDRVAGLRQGAVSGPYGVLLHSPELAELVAALGNYVRWNAALTPRQTETAVLAAAREWDARLMWGSHVRLGSEAGVPEATIEAIGQRRPVDGIEADEGAIVTYVRELLREHRVTEDTFRALHTVVGDQGIVDLTGLVGYYGLVASILNAFEVEPPPGAAELPA